MSTPILIDLQQPPVISELYIGHDLIQGDFLIYLCKKYGNKIAIIVDNSLKKLYGTELSKKLSAQLFEIPDGEKGKTREIKQMVEDQMLKAGFGRDTVVIGLGGGATTDLAGFVASTYLRGVPLILIPTSLLAMVDAAIGGKTAVDTSYGKNLIGSFYHPKAIVSDLSTLKTLPENEKINGFAEIIKMGLIFDSEILTFVKNSHSFDVLVTRASKAKIAIVTQDPFDKGLRRILNFGHTIGHALEAISNFTLSHGEAVAIGCIAESYLSVQLGFLSEQQFSQIEMVCKDMFSSAALPNTYERKKLIQSMAFDKKKSVEGIRFVLIDQIGHAIPFNGEYCRAVKEEDLESTLSYMEQNYA